jgi:signal transduction histidine kinase
MRTESKKNDRERIIGAYLEYFDAYTQRNWDQMVSRFSQEFSMFGTGIDEYSTSTSETLAFYKREFDQSPSIIEYKINRIEVFLTSSTSATVIMVKEVDEWRIAHGHWSQPAEGQDVGDSIPYKLLKQRNKELEETVSDRTKEIEKQNIKLRNLNDTKTKLLSIIAHDLRSPFNAFMGLTEVMLLNFKEKLQNPDYFKLRLQQIHERAQHLYSVADNLLNWAWTQTDEISINWSTSKVDTIINEQVIALHDMAKGKDIAIALNIDSNSTVYTDPEILGIIIRNFVSNALKYSHRGGTININAIPNGRYTLLTIADRGVGMDQTKIQSVLTANNLDSLPGTEKEKGIGLGLQISLDLLNRIKSSYTIDSTPNVGTTISISIPTNPS